MTTIEDKPKIKKILSKFINIKQLSDIIIDYGFYIDEVLIDKIFYWISCYRVVMLIEKSRIMYHIQIYSRNYFHVEYNFNFAFDEFEKSVNDKLFNKSEVLKVFSIEYKSY